MEQVNQPLSLRRQRRMKHGVLTACRLISEQFEGEVFSQFFITLTYRPSDSWAPDHVVAFIQRLVRNYLKRDMGREVGYVWKLELTKSGLPHYHVALWVSGSIFLPNLDDAGYWSHGFTRVQRARNCVGYMAKYLGKNEEGVLPPGARLWGFGGLSGERGRELRWWRAPRWLRKFIPLEHGIQRMRRGWWRDLTTNWSYRSPYEWDWLTLKFVFVGWERDRFDMSGLVAFKKGVLTTDEEWQVCYGSS